MATSAGYFVFVNQWKNSTFLLEEIQLEYDNYLHTTYLSDAEGTIKKKEAEWKEKLNDIKVEAEVQRDAKKMLLSILEDTGTNKLKHNVK